MLKRFTHGFITLTASALLVACGGTPYSPQSNGASPVDANMYSPKVDSFVVLLDSSGSMDDEANGSSKIHTAQDTAASFNSAVPSLPFQSALVVFGKGTQSCIGPSITDTVYGMATHEQSGFAEALGSIKCAASTTPIAEAISSATDMIDTEESGPAAVFIISDTVWKDATGVSDAVAGMREKHGSNVCIHVIKVGDETVNDALIGDLLDLAGCDSTVSAASLASADAMSTYVAGTLLAPLEYEKHSVAATALFAFDKAILTREGMAELHNLGEYIRSQGMAVRDIDIIGHTDSKGSEEYNQGLSERRATAVAKYLVSQGVDGGMIDVSGMGESSPVASNDTEAGRAKNRRVEVNVGTSRLIN